MILTFWANERREILEDEVTRLGYFLKDSHIAPPRLVRSSSSDSTSDDSSCHLSDYDCSQRYPLSSTSRVLFGTYWEKSKKSHTAGEDANDAAEQASPTNTDIDFQISILPADISRQRRQIFPTPSISHRTANSCTLRSMDGSSDSISSWPRSSMKTYPKSAFRRVKQKRRHSKQKQVISFDPDVQILEYKKEELHTTGDAWILWFQ